MTQHPLSHDQIAALSSRLQHLARALVFEGEDADVEDLVQDAWLAALEREQWPRRTFGFLRTVVRRRRARVRWRSRMRLEREESAARPEGAQEIDVSERECTARFIGRLVHELGSPYREVIEARYFRDLDVAHIAELLERPPETVRTQLQRGLARLRERLDGNDGAREIWASSLLQAAGLRDSFLASVEPGARLTSSTAAVGVSSAVLIVAAGAGFWLWPQAVEAADAPVGPVLEVAGSGPDAQLPEQDGESEEVRVVAVEEPAAPPGPSDPAAAPSPAAVTEPLDENTTRLVLVVEDALDQPIPRAYAEVRGIGRRLLHAGPIGEDGRLELDIALDELIDEFPMQGSITVSACTPELAWPGILLAKMEGGTQRTVRIRLDRRSVRLHGVVTDTEGVPVPRASIESRVAVAEQRGLEAGLLRVPMLLEIWADENGVYDLPGVAPERQAVRVTKPGFVTLPMFVTPQGEDTRQDFVLSRGGIVAGFVSHPDGRPASGARVWIGTPSLQPRHLPDVRADGDGFFLMSGLSDGEWEVFACDAAEPSLFAWSRVEVRDGEEAGFEAVLAPTSGVRVRVLDREGQPLDAIGVVLTPSEPRSMWSAKASTDASGRVQFLHVPDVPLDVRVFPGSLQGAGDTDASRSGLRVGERELVVQVGAQEAHNGRLRGTLRQASGEPFSGALVCALAEEESNPPVSPAGEPLLGAAQLNMTDVQPDGGFGIDDLAPGEHRLLVLSALPEAAGTFDLGLHTILAGETLDVGERGPPPAHVVRFERPGSDDLILEARVGPFWQQWMRTAFEDSLEIQVFPGTYRVSTSAGPIRFEVPGARTVVIPE